RCITGRRVALVPEREFRTKRGISRSDRGIPQTAGGRPAPLGDKEGVMDMPAWAWILIAVVVVLVAAAAAWAAYGQRRKGLRDRFGPEYDRTVAERGGRMKAEAELA